MHLTLPNKHACRQAGLGYLFLQKHCSCEPKNNPPCCPERWKLVYAGSRFTSECESGYSPTKGEALVVSWALDNGCLFVLRCTNLIVATDHKPLLGIYKVRELNTIPNPRLQSFKEKTLAYRFSIHHCPVKWHQCPDAVSHHPVHQIIPSYDSPTQKDLNHAYSIKNRNQELINQSLELINEPNATPHSTIANIDDPVITTSQLQNHCKEDPTYQLLIQTITMGFPQWRMIYQMPSDHFGRYENDYQYQIR